VNHRCINTQEEHYNASVMEDAAVGTTVATVSATDLDLDQNGQVTYFLEMTSADVGHFVIDKVTGVITLARYVAFTTPARGPIKRSGIFVIFCLFC